MVLVAVKHHVCLLSLSRGVVFRDCISTRGVLKRAGYGLMRGVVLHDCISTWGVLKRAGYGLMRGVVLHDCISTWGVLKRAGYGLVERGGFIVFFTVLQT